LGGQNIINNILNSFGLYALQFDWSFEIFWVICSLIWLVFWNLLGDMLFNLIGLLKYFRLYAL